LGRILRPKARSENEFNAFFYSLVSKDTIEMYYSTKRQQFLIDQGYSFKVISELPIAGEQLEYGTKEEQIKLLAEVVAQKEEVGEEEKLTDNDLDELFRSAGPAKRTSGGGRSLSGGSNALYSEFKSKEKHSLFRQRDRAKKK